MSIKLEVNDAAAQAKVNKLKLLVQSQAFDAPVDKAGFRCYRDLVIATPKRYSGLTRRSWKVTKPQVGQRLIFNDSKVMLFLEGGTGNAGTTASRGGYIYPKTKKALFVPLTASASLNGWSPGLVYGTDYVMAKRVKGIRPMMIVEKYRPKARAILKEEMKAFLKQNL